MVSTTGFDEVRHRYIIREIKTQGQVEARNDKTDEDRLIYLVPIHGTEYDTDNCTVWHEIHNCYIGTTAYD